MELTEASVFRSTSVSSSRRITVPPVRRAYNQLKMKVRALPTWRNPVGDGAKRTRGLSEAVEFDMIGIRLSMVRAAKSIGQAARLCCEMCATWAVQLSLQRRLCT